MKNLRFMIIALLCLGLFIACEATKSDDGDDEAKPSAPITVTKMLIEDLSSDWYNQEVVSNGIGIGGWGGADAWTTAAACASGTADGTGKFEFTFTPALTDVSTDFEFGGTIMISGVPAWNAPATSYIRFLPSPQGGQDSVLGTNVKITNPMDGNSYYIYCKVTGQNWNWSLVKN